VIESAFDNRLGAGLV